MMGRIVGFVAGALIALTGYGLLKPAVFAKYVDFSKLSLGPFAEYHAIACWLIMAFGAVVAVAALQRPANGGRRRRPSAMTLAPVGPEPEAPHSHAPSFPEPEPEPVSEAEEEPAELADQGEIRSTWRARHRIKHEASFPSRRSPSPSW